LFRELEADAAGRGAHECERLHGAGRLVEDGVGIREGRSDDMIARGLEPSHNYVIDWRRDQVGD
jgi:hypothetical protein